jgi:hypothetical protein
MNYYLDLAAEFGARARWRMVAVLFAADYVRANELPMEAALLLAADPSADVVELAGRYRDDDWITTREMFERAAETTGVMVPTEAEAMMFVLAVNATRVDTGASHIDDFIWPADRVNFLDVPGDVVGSIFCLENHVNGWPEFSKREPLQAVAHLASFLDGRSIPEWLELITDPSRDSSAFAEPVPEATLGRRGRGRSLAVRAIRRIRGGRSA